MDFDINTGYCLKEDALPSLPMLRTNFFSWCQTQAYRSSLFSSQGSFPCHGAGAQLSWAREV